MRSIINAERYIPSALTESIVKPEYGIEVYWSEDPTMFSAIGFVGKSKKSKFHYRFRSMERMMEHVNGFIADEIKWADRRAAEKAERKQRNSEITAEAHFKVGDLLVNSWGYEQTNIDFFVVTAVKGKTIEVAEVYGAQVEGSEYSHGMACEVVATNEIKPDGKRYKLRVKAGYQGSVSLSQPKSFYYIHKWDGRPQYMSWYY